MPASGGVPRPLRPQGGGSHAALVAGRPLDRVRTRSRLRGGIFVSRPDGTDERRLTDTGGWPVWWPDGRRLAFLRVQSDGTQRVETVDLEQPGTPVPLPVRFTGSNYPIDIGSGGRSVALTNAVHVVSELWVLDARTGSAR